MLKLLLALVLASVAGCAVHSAPPPQDRRRGAVQDDHVCIGACDHFFVDGGWVVEPGHRHGPDCGHQLVNGKWKKVKPADKDGDERPPDKKN